MLRLEKPMSARPGSSMSRPSSGIEASGRSGVLFSASSRLISRHPPQKRAQESADRWRIAARPNRGHRARQVVTPSSSMVSRRTTRWRRPPRAPGVGLGIGASDTSLSCPSSPRWSSSLAALDGSGSPPRRRMAAHRESPDDGDDAVSRAGTAPRRGGQPPALAVGGPFTNLALSDPVGRSSRGPSFFRPSGSIGRACGRHS